jgi:hypothetical protein
MGAGVMFGHAYRGSDEMNSIMWFKNAEIKLKFCFLPKRCYDTNKLLWFKYAYRTRNTWRVEDTLLIHDDRWYTKNEFVMMRLKHGV